MLIEHVVIAKKKIPCLVVQRKRTETEEQNANNLRPEIRPGRLVSFCSHPYNTLICLQCDHLELDIKKKEKDIYVSEGGLKMVNCLNSDDTRCRISAVIVFYSYSKKSYQRR